LDVSKDCIVYACAGPARWEDGLDYDTWVATDGKGRNEVDFVLESLRRLLINSPEHDHLLAGTEEEIKARIRFIGASKFRGFASGDSLRKPTIILASKVWLAM